MKSVIDMSKMVKANPIATSRKIASQLEIIPSLLSKVIPLVHRCNPGKFSGTICILRFNQTAKQPPPNGGNDTRTRVRSAN